MAAAGGILEGCLFLPATLLQQLRASIPILEVVETSPGRSCEGGGEIMLTTVMERVRKSHSHSHASLVASLNSCLSTILAQQTSSQL